MTKLLFRLFIPKGDVSDPNVRAAYGKLSGFTGIILNIILVAGKLTAGLISGSVSIVADALNNLSDAGSSVITFIGFRLAGRKPDKEHPFGHGRIEYIAGLIVSVIIIFMGIELIQTSVEKIINPQKAVFSYLALGVLCASILFKLWMFFFNRKIAKTINSPSVAATATDSISDVIATSVVLAALVCGMYTDFPVDGTAGIIVALFILKGGISALKDTQAPLLGRPISKELAEQIDSLALEHENILGVHDLIYHDYGPGRALLSFHVEVPAELSVIAIHSMIDHIEREIYSKYGIEAVIHMDPVCSGGMCAQVQTLALQAAQSVHPDATIHDVQMVDCDGANKVYFDMILPYGLEITDAQAAALAAEYLKQNGIDAEVRIDHPYVEA